MTVLVDINQAEVHRADGEHFRTGDTAEMFSGGGGRGGKRRESIIPRRSASQRPDSLPSSRYNPCKTENYLFFSFFFFSGSGEERERD